ncbi:MAG: hypothetical protein ACKOQ3_00945 [Novosphingobium sp.]
MSSVAAILPWVLIALWCGYVFVTVPETAHRYPRTSRYWLAQKLFGGKRGVMMLAGVLVIGFASGLLLAVSA